MTAFSWGTIDLQNQHQRIGFLTTRMMRKNSPDSKVLNTFCDVVEMEDETEDVIEIASMS